MASPASNKPHLAEKISGLASNLAHLGQMWLPPGRGAAAGWQMMLPAQSGSSSAQTVGDHALVEGTEKVSEHSVITQRTIYNYLVVCWIFCIFK